MNKYIILLFTSIFGLVSQDMELPQAGEIVMGIPVVEAEQAVVMCGIPVAAARASAKPELNPKSVALSRTHLIDAIEKGCPTLVDALAPLAGVNFLFERSGAYKRCYTPLSLAASLGKPTCMRILLKHGAQVDFSLSAVHEHEPALHEHGDELSDLMLACRHANKESVELLLAHGADINRPILGDDVNHRVLSCAALSGNLDFVKFISTKQTEGVFKSQLNGALSVIFALPLLPSSGWQKYKDIAQYLVENGAVLRADVAKDVLFKAIDNKKASLVKFILDQKVLNTADLNHRYSTLEKALLAGNVNVLKALVAAGIDVNRKIGHRTALMQALADNSIECAGYLIELGADVNYTCPFNLTPLGEHESVLNCAKSIAGLKLIINAGVNVSGSLGRRPFQLAVGDKSSTGVVDMELVELLVAKGFDVNTEWLNRKQHRSGPLHYVMKELEHSRRYSRSRAARIASLQQLELFLRSHRARLHSHTCVVQ